MPAVGARSWWLDEALRADAGAPCPPPAGDVTADVCVVGGGFAGLWAAYELGERDPSLGIVLLEADIVGAGGSGANGGFFSPSWTGLSSLCKALGEEGGVAYAAALADMVTSSTAGSPATTLASTPTTRASCTPGPASGSPGRTTRPSGS